jgi:UDP-glucose 4-epimerase
LSESPTHLEIVHGDLTNPVDLSVALTGMEIVVHLVSTTLPKTSNDNPIYDVETNILGTLNLLNLARDLGISKIVFASSGGTVYGQPLEYPIPETHPTNPICSYGITKLTIEKHLYLFRHLYGLDYVVLRPANPYGPRQNPATGLGAIVTFLDRVLNDKAITIWGDGTVARDYFYVSDLVRAFVRVIEGSTPSRVYNIGSGRPCSLNAILATIERLAGVAPKVQFLPARAVDLPLNCLDISRAKEELGWVPEVTLDEGIARTWSWLKERTR